jgi:methionine-gamma-lyase
VAEEKRKKTADQVNKELRDRWDKLHFDTQQGRAGEDPYPTATGSLRIPLYATKSYAYSTLDELLKNHYNYSRTENPTLYALDQKLATLHGGEAALSVASGMSAVHLALSSIIQTRVERKREKKIRELLPQNDPEKIPNVLIHNNQYTGVYRLLTKIYPQTGVMAKIIDMRNLDEVKNAIDINTRGMFIETPSNPNLDVLDIKSCTDIIHEAGGKCIVDNTFASPALQKPLNLGVDLVVESLTKFINGHGDTLGGAIIGPKNELQNIRYFWLETFGPVMHPFSAWLILRGCRTLSMRMERHCSNAKKIAQFLEKHPKIEKVIYPGLKSHPNHEIAKKQMKDFGGMIGFELKTVEACYKFINSLKLIKVGVSLGDTTSLIEYTSVMTGIDLASWEKRRMRMSDTHFRFSVGLEDPEDLINDLAHALEKI